MKEVDFMKIYVSHSSNCDYVREIYEPLKESKLYDENEFYLPHDGNVFNTKEVIKNSDLLVAECSSNSTGQGIEIGWADSFNVPILCIYKTGSSISSSLKFITNNIISYNSLDEFLECISNFILDGGQNGQRKVFSFYLFNYKR